MTTLSTSPTSASAFTDALNRLRTVAQDYPTEFKWLGGILAVFLPVSYTHLDVYKRQGKTVVFCHAFHVQLLKTSPFKV